MLDFFAPATGLFTSGTTQAAEVFADMASPTLDLALRLSASTTVLTTAKLRWKAGPASTWPAGSS